MVSARETEREIDRVNRKKTKSIVISTRVKLAREEEEVRRGKVKHGERERKKKVLG